MMIKIDAIDVYLECSAHFSNLFFFHDEESYITNHFMTDPSGNSELCLPRISVFMKSICTYPVVVVPG